MADIAIDTQTREFLTLTFDVHLEASYGLRRGVKTYLWLQWMAKLVCATDWTAADMINHSPGYDEDCLPFRNTHLRGYLRLDTYSEMRDWVRFSVSTIFFWRICYRLIIRECGAPRERPSFFYKHIFHTNNHISYYYYIFFFKINFTFLNIYY